MPFLGDMLVPWRVSILRIFLFHDETPLRLGEGVEPTPSQPRAQPNMPGRSGPTHQLRTVAWIIFSNPENMFPLKLEF